MKALYLYSDKTGHKKPKIVQRKILKKLNQYFELTAVKTNDFEEFKNYCSTTFENNYDVLIVGGGDGTFNSACSAVASLPRNKRPIIGYIPLGTVNDSGKTFGVRGSVRQALKILKNKQILDYDICSANNSFFTYVCAIGQYTDISYIAKRNEKKHFGRLSYYRLAIKEAFQKKIVHVEIDANGKHIEADTPFVLILSGKNVGGFKINFKKSYNDGFVDIFLTKPGLFNGLLHYLFFKVKTIHIQSSEFHIHTNQVTPWCLDGEKGPIGDLNIKCLHSHLNVFGKK